MDKQASSVHDSWNQDALDTSLLNGQASLVQSNMEQDPTANGAHDAKNEPRTTFPSFPKLPVELRCKMWRRFVSEEETSAFRSKNWVIGWRRMNMVEVSSFRAFMYLSNSAHSTILHASHESRTEGLKHYTLDFEVENAHPRFTVSRPARTYINWKADDRACVNETNDFRSEPDLNILSHFIDLCKERGLQSIAIDVKTYCKKDLLIAMSDGTTSVREILLFSANSWVIQREMSKKRVALRFYTMAKLFIEHTMKREQGVYCNTGDIKWQTFSCMEDLKIAEAVLLDGFKERERKLAEKLETNGGTAEAGTLELARPHIKWCKVKLKLLPGQTEGADTVPTRRVGIAIAS